MFVQFSCKETCNGTLEATPAGVVQIELPLFVGFGEVII